MNNYPKVLISYFFGPGSIPLGASCARALKSLGSDVYCFDCASDSPVERYILKYADKITKAAGLERIAAKARWRNPDYRQRLLERAVSDFKPDILLLMRGHWFEQDFIEHLKKSYGVKKVVGWWVKGPKWFDLMLAEAGQCDYYFCIHKEGYGPSDINHLPALAVDEVLYRRMGDDITRDTRNIVFVGGYTAERQEILGSLKGYPLSIYGTNWFKKNLFNAGMLRMIKKSGVWDEDLVRLYNEAKIVLNVSSWNTAKLSGLNLRIFDVPACGAFLLTDYSEELREYFTPGEDIETFSDIDELKDKIEYYLKNCGVRERIARNGYRKVLQLGTFKDKMIDLLNRVWFNK
jgi:spore maturation protein CgeB